MSENVYTLLKLAIFKIKSEKMNNTSSRTMLISGGSRGIGRATAILAAKCGWQVVITYKSDEKAAQQTLQIIKADGGKAAAVKCEVSCEEDVIRCFDYSVEYFGELNAVVINAGVVGPSTTLAKMPTDRLKLMFDINIFGAFLFAREAARRLPDASEGRGASIVFVSSAASRLGSPFEYVDYAASKGAIDTLTIGLSKELAPQKIRVNAVRPGLIETDIHASGGQPDRAQRLGQGVPFGRAGKPDEVANAILWLSSEAASYTTGAILDVAGGR